MEYRVARTREAKWKFPPIKPPNTWEFLATGGLVAGAIGIGLINTKYNILSDARTYLNPIALLSHSWQFDLSSIAIIFAKSWEASPIGTELLAGGGIALAIGAIGIAGNFLFHPHDPTID